MNIEMSTDEFDAIVELAEISGRDISAIDVFVRAYVDLYHAPMSTAIVEAGRELGFEVARPDGYQGRHRM